MDLLAVKTTLINELRASEKRLAILQKRNPRTKKQMLAIQAELRHIEHQIHVCKKHLPKIERAIARMKPRGQINPTQ